MVKVMTPQEKANELVKLHKQILLRGQFQISGFYIDQIAEECALIAVDNILNNFGSLSYGKSHYCDYAAIKYYEEVKQEIEKL